MANEIVKYQNKFAEINFNQFNRAESNIFFAIISRLRDHHSEEVDLSFHHIEKLSDIHYGRKLSRFKKDLWGTYHKINNLSLYVTNKSHSKRGEINLFSYFIIDDDNKICKIKLNPDFSSLLNDIAKAFTRFSLKQFDELRSTYVKTMFRTIKRFRTTGIVILPIKKFRRILGVPKSYSGNQITQRIIEPIEIELTPLIKNLHVIKVKKHGNKISGFKFKFAPESPKHDDFSKGAKYDLDKKIRYIKWNQFLPPRLKRKALERIKPKQKKKKRREPMGIFNDMLKKAPLDQLKWYMRLHKEHSPLINLSEYQMRKLRRAINIKERNKSISKITSNNPRVIPSDKDQQIISERKLNRIFKVQKNDTKKH